MKTNITAKGFLLLFAFVLISSQLIAQGSVKWVQGNKGKTDYKLWALVADEEGFVAGVTVGAFMKPVNEARVLKYNKEMQFLGESKVQGAVPQTLEMGGFGKMLWIKDLASAKPGAKDGNTMTFYDKEGQIIKQHVLDNSYKYQIVTGNIMSAVMNNDYSNIKVEVPVFKSTDQDYLLLWGYRDEQGSKKADKDHSIIVYVFGEDGEIAMSETFIVENVFGEDAIINSLQPDITPNGSLLLFSRYMHKAGKARFSMAHFKEAGQKPTVYKYELPYESPAYEWSYGEDNDVYIAGTSSIGNLIPSFTKNNNRLLFFMMQDLNQESPAKATTYELNPAFYNQYPEFLQGKYLILNLTWPSLLATCSDGVLYVSENSEKVTVTYSSDYGSAKKTSYKAYSFSVIKFDFSGKIQWLKMITKKVSVKEGYEDMLDWSWSQEGDVVTIHYSDHPLNVTRPKGKLVLAGSHTVLGTAIANIHASGDIKIRVVNDPTKSKIFGLPSMTEYMGDEEFVMAGLKYKMMSLPEFYYGTSKLSE